MAKELKIISDFYDFMVWTLHHTEKFPRHHRYSTGMIIENRLHTILGLLLRAKFRRDKTAFLEEANLELDILRFQLRLAKDLQVLPIKSHGYAARALEQIGSQIGGWQKERKLS